MRTRGGGPAAVRLLRVAVLTGLTLASAPALPASDLVLRPDIRIDREIVTLADLVEGASGDVAGRPLFRAPALGDTGTIQVARVIEAAQGLGITGIDTGGRAQVMVLRSARRIGGSDIEAAVKAALESRHGVPAIATTIVFDGGAPSFFVDAKLKTALLVEDLVYDPRSHRLAATIAVAETPSGHPRNLRVTGVAVETVETAVLTRAVGRGDTLNTADMIFERRIRNNVPVDAIHDPALIAGHVARRALVPGGLLRAADIHRPEVVVRNEAVTVVYQAPALTLTVRGKALEGGAVGDTIAVVNLQTKRTLQATVTAPGQVAVAALPGPVVGLAKTQ